MDTFSALLVLCEGNPPVTGGFPLQWPVTRSFDVFFDLRLNKRLSRQLRRRWFETPSPSLLRHCIGPRYIYRLSPWTNAQHRDWDKMIDYSDQYVYRTIIFRIFPNVFVKGGLIILMHLTTRLFYKVMSYIKISRRREKHHDWNFTWYSYKSLQTLLFIWNIYTSRRETSPCYVQVQKDNMILDTFIYYCNS